jgi:outer membrane protein assembly factor BamB
MLCYVLVACLSFVGSVYGQHRLICQGNGKLAIVEADGTTSWQLDWGGIHDIHVLASGNIMVQQGLHRVVEIDRQTKQIVWTYDAKTQNSGSPEEAVEVHAFQPLDNGHVMIAESGRARIIEVDRQGKIQTEIKLHVDRPHPHRDTRLVRRLADGHYLVCHEGDGVVREYDHQGQVVWDFAIPMFGRQATAGKTGHGPDAYGNQVFGAVRLPNGNTLIATGNNHRVLEVTPDKKIVWQLEQDDLPGITLAWVTTLEVLANGNYVIGNCHAGEGQPLLIELEPKTKQVVWKFDGYAEFGNNVSNSQLLDQETKSIR